MIFSKQHFIAILLTLAMLPLYASATVPVEDEKVQDYTQDTRDHLQEIDEIGGWGDGWFKSKEKEFVSGGMGIGDIFGALTDMLDISFSGDSVTQLAGQQLLRQFSDGVLGWVQGGQFDGGPLFVTNYYDFLSSSAGNASNVFLEDFDIKVLDQLPSMFNGDVRILLEQYDAGRDVPFSNEMTCSISNVDAFYDDFSVGGWDAWDKMFEPGCNPYSAYFHSKDEMIARENFALETAKAEYLAGDGFTPQRECIEHMPSGACARFASLTPGSVIQAQLGHALNLDLANFEAIDEVNELVIEVLKEVFRQVDLGSTFFEDIQEGLMPIN